MHGFLTSCYPLLKVKVCFRKGLRLGMCDGSCNLTPAFQHKQLEFGLRSHGFPQVAGAKYLYAARIHKCGDVYEEAEGRDPLRSGRIIWMMTLYSFLFENNPVSEISKPETGCLHVTAQTLRSSVRYRYTPNCKCTYTDFFCGRY